MGLQRDTSVTVAGVRRARVSVHLDSNALQIGGRPRLEIPLSEVRALERRGTVLVLTCPTGVIEFDAGVDADAWAAKIRAPPSRAKKLGLKPGLRVAIVGLDDAALREELAGVEASVGPAEAAIDLVFLGVDTPRDLARLPALVRALAPDGAIWIVRTKGRSATVREDEVRAAGLAAGLVDVKVVAFSATQSADKFVIPVARRGR